MAANTESKFLRFASRRLVRIRGHVNFDGTYSFHGGKENVRFKKLLRLFWTLCLRLSSTCMQ